MIMNERARTLIKYLCIVFLLLILIFLIIVLLELRQTKITNYLIDDSFRSTGNTKRIYPCNFFDNGSIIKELSKEQCFLYKNHSIKILDNFKEKNLTILFNKKGSLDRKVYIN